MTTNTTGQFLIQVCSLPGYFEYRNLACFATWDAARAMIATDSSGGHVRIVNPNGLISWAGRFGC